MSMTVRASLYGLPRKFWRIWHLESRQNIVRIQASGSFDGNAESVKCASIYLGVLQKSPDFWWTYSHKESIIPLPEIYSKRSKHGHKSEGIKKHKLKLLEYESEYYESSISEGFGVVVECCWCVLPTFVVYLSLDLPMSVISDLWPHSMLSRIKECHKMILSVPILFPHPSLGILTNHLVACTSARSCNFIYFSRNEKQPTWKNSALK